MFWRRKHKTESRVPVPGASAADIGLAIKFVAEAGKQMLEASPSVSEVLDNLRRLLPVVGLEGAMIDANLSTLTLSYWGPGMDFPVTTMRPGVSGAADISPPGETARPAGQQTAEQ